ncbi:MAG: IS1595 family transposase [Caulobacteraceae bacterium]|nr:IS1595 family transposase [Caulobacteraceae bacterium]
MQSALNAPQFQSEEAAFAYVEGKLWPNGATCPHCGVVGEATRSKGKTTRAGLWNCRACRKPFTVRMGTIFESSHVPLQVWLQAIYLMCSSKKGISTRQLQRTFGGSMKTAWFLSHRIREAMADDSLAPFGGGGGDVEADETYIGQEPQEPRGNKGGSKMKVMSMIDRTSGRARSVVIDFVTTKTVTDVILANVSPDARLITDQAPQYLKVGREMAGHKSVNHRRREYVSKADVTVHTNTVEGYFSVFKRGMRGVYQHCSKKHLARYAAEFDFRYSNRIAVGVDDKARAENALAGFAGKRLTYETVSRRWPSAEGRIVW